MTHKIHALRTPNAPRKKPSENFVKNQHLVPITAEDSQYRAKHRSDLIKHALCCNQLLKYRLLKECLNEFMTVFSLENSITKQR